MARPIASTPKLSRRETREFLKKVSEGLKSPTGPIPTPKIDAAIERVMQDARRSDSFKKELEGLLNSHCIETDMPDFLLAERICGFIQAVGDPIKKTLEWHGCDSICHPKGSVGTPFNCGHGPEPWK